MPIRPENKNRYPKQWPEISLRIRQRAAWQCECSGDCGMHHGQRCEAKQNQPHPKTGSTVILTVAHLDHTPENCNDDNLKAMCQRCHLNYDSKHHQQSRWNDERCKETKDLFA